MTTPSGLASLPLKYLRDTLAACSAFQTMVGAANATEALDSIHYVAAPGGTAFPLAVVYFAGQQDGDVYAGGVRNHFEHTGELGLHLYGAVSDVSDAAIGDEQLAFMNTVGAILGDLVQLAGQAGYLSVTSWSLSPPMRPDEDEARSNRDYHLAEILVRFASAS